MPGRANLFKFNTKQRRQTHEKICNENVRISTVSSSLLREYLKNQSGDKVKTDRRDAIMLAKLHRAGELDAIHVPDPQDEAICDLCRARTDARQDLQAAWFRLKSFLLRNGYKYPMKTAWTAKHMDYLRALTLEDPAHRMILEELLMQTDSLLEKIERYNKMLETQVESWRWKPVVEALQAMRGIKLLTATVLIAELGDLRRFDSARKLMLTF